MIVEVERMTDHVLLIGHRVVARVLLAYFLGLDRNDVAKLDVPLGRLYGLEPVSDKIWLPCWFLRCADMSIVTETIWYSIQFLPVQP